MTMHRQIKVLLVEDAAEDAEMLLREIRVKGLDVVSRRVDTSADYEEALATFSPDLILSDYTLPGFDGTDALQIAKSRSPDTPFIFVSGTIGEERAIQALKQGAVDYVLKESRARWCRQSSARCAKPMTAMPGAGRSANSRRAKSASVLPCIFHRSAWPSSRLTAGGSASIPHCAISSDTARTNCLPRMFSRSLIRTTGTPTANRCARCSTVRSRPIRPTSAMSGKTVVSCGLN